MNVDPRPSVDQFQEWIDSGRLDAIAENSQLRSAGARPHPGDSYQTEQPNPSLFQAKRPAPQPLSLGSAAADDAAVEAMARAIQDPALLDAIQSGNANKIRLAVDAAAAKAAKLLGESFDFKHPGLIQAELRRTIRRAVMDMQAGRPALASLAAALRHTGNFKMTTIDPTTVKTRPAVDFDQPVSLDDDANTIVVRSAAGILRGETLIEVAGAKGSIGDLLAKASLANDKKAYVAAVDAAAQVIIAELTKAGKMPSDEKEAKKITRAIHQILFSSGGYKAQGAEADEALVRALQDSGHFPIKVTPEEPIDDEPSPVTEAARNKAAVEEISKVLSGETKLDGQVDGVTGDFATALAQASAAGDRDAYIASVEAASKAILSKMEEHGLVTEENRSEIRKALIEVLFQAGAALNEGLSVEEALTRGQSATGNFVDDQPGS